MQLKSLHSLSSVPFRYDINGLRAWAVMAVLFFHFSLIGLPGGFAGVDVFFVVSGYLMTAIIVSGHEKGNFSVWKFYLARARRILPALMVVITVLLALGWFWLPTVYYQELGTQSVYSLLFLSNIHYALSAGYFDGASQEKWLLHTWSLAVEAQFYVLYPLFITVIWRFWPGIKAVTVGLGLLFVISLVMSLVVSYWQPTFAFYLLPTRGWEFAAGGLVYLVSRLGWVGENIKKKIFWLGLVLVFTGFAFIDESMAWPGYWAIFPVLGASLIILGHRESNALLMNGATQWLGDRSYSLYLWHWPILVGLYLVGLHNEFGWVLGFLTISLVLAHFSYAYIEIPTRKYLSKKSMFKEVVFILLAGALFVLAYIVSTKMFDNRVSANIETAASGKQDRFSYSGCGFSDCNFASENFNYILFGDSHAQAIHSAFEYAANANKSDGAEPLRVKLISTPNCPSIRGTLFPQSRSLYPFDRCKAANDDIFQKLKSVNSEIPMVIMDRITSKISGPLPVEAKHADEVGRPRIYFSEEHNSLNNIFIKEFEERYISSVCSFAQFRDVYLVLPIPEMGVSVPQELVKRLTFNDKRDVKVPLNDYYERHAIILDISRKAAEQCNVQLLDPVPYLCDQEYCFGSEGGRSLYFDDDHLNEYGNKLLIPMFRRVFAGH